MQYKEIGGDELTKFFLSEPMLVTLGLPDDEMIYLFENKEFICHPGSKFIEIVEEDGTSIAVIRWEFVTQIAISIHVYLREKYQHTGKLKEIFDFVYLNLLTDTAIRKVIAFIAESCIHVVKAVEKLGFTKDGLTTDCLIWRNKVEGMFTYSITLKEDKEV